ncbi:MAG: LysR family transcriptional regulator [Neisseria sp.]|nr:LysR family transcriptional regulator [Neisseria sp.]
MNLNAVKLFTAVVQQGSLLGAAQKTGVAVATLSRKISELEKSLNVQLLERSSQGVKPTLIGQQLFEQSQASIDTLDEIARNIQSNQQHIKGKLRLSIPQAFEQIWTMIDAFQTAFPDIELHILASDRKLDLLADGIDAAIRIGDLQTDSLIAKPLAPIRHKLVASPDFIAKHGTPRTPSHLKNYPLTAWTATAEQTAIWHLGKTKQPIKANFASNDYQHIKHHILRGKTIGELPHFLANPLIESGELVAILPDYPFPTTPVHLLYPSHKLPSSVVRVWVGFCGGGSDE